MPTKPRTHNPLPHMSRRDADRAYDRRRANTPDLSTAKQIRSSSRWQRVRYVQLQRNPLCEECHKHGHTTRATDVHHIVPLHVRPSLAFHFTNLMSVCRSCHNRLDATQT